jgi:uncharacterized Ntn-hydrolase superfamily protein
VTYSIVARDAATGQLGVAVQSHYFSVGPVVPWARAGVGAVATQSLVEPSYGPRGLELMAQGLSASDALARFLAADDGAAVRQVAMVDPAGTVSAHTGDRCIAEAGHATGTGFSCQANMMLNDTVWDAMAAAYEAAAGDLAARLLAALRAAEAEGGDIRGRQSAALLVVGPKDTGQPWPGGDVVVDLRVEDHPEPLDELARLLDLHRAYVHAEEFDRHIEAGDTAGAWDEIIAAERLAPGNLELLFWKGVTLAEQGHEADARAVLVEVYRADPRWAELLRRLPDVGLAPKDADLITRLAASPD